MTRMPADRDDRQDLFGIADLAKEFGISTRTIRFYENKDLIHPMRVNGSRVYTRRDRGRLALILRAKAIGSTLAQIKHFLDLYGAPSFTNPYKTTSTLACLIRRCRSGYCRLAYAQRRGHCAQRRQGNPTAYRRSLTA